VLTGDYGSNQAALIKRLFSVETDRVVENQGIGRGGNAMTFEEVKSAVLSLNATDQERVITEIVPLLWPKACLDDSCLDRMRDIVDDETVKEYRAQHKGEI
jgi:hypothetical protein